MEIVASLARSEWMYPLALQNLLLGMINLDINKIESVRSSLDGRTLSLLA